MGSCTHPSNAAFTIATICLLLASAASAFGTYSEATLERLAQASSLSYLSLDKMQSSPYYESCNFQPIAQVVDDETESGATIFRAEDGSGGPQKLVVACRGSANPNNFRTNLKFNLVPATRLSQNYIPEDARVHDGFQTASVGLWKELSQPLSKLLLDNSPSEVVFTGHSLGAATALLCATHYRASYSNQPSPSIITFGGPKLCNSALARHLRNEALEGSNILHLVHSKDPVLANNQGLWDRLGFESVGIELECDPHSPTLAEEGGGKQSLFGNLAWNIVDHCKYMGVFVGPRALF
ncbi:hypothetical protein ACHAXT_010747 [Thalassiosira profunda]